MRVTSKSLLENVKLTSLCALNRDTLAFGLVIFFSFALAGCSSLSADLEHASSTSEHNNVALLGVTVRKGVKSDLRVLSLTKTLGREIRRERQLGTLPMVLTRKALGAKAHDKILENFTEVAGLSQESQKALRQARLGSRYAIIARLENNQVRNIKLVYAKDDKRRDFLQNRTDARVAAERLVTLSAVVYDTRSGREIWRQAYKVSATSESMKAVFEGDSFVGNMVASVANVLNNGLASESGPPAPSLPQTVNAGLVEIARGMPMRGRIDRYREVRAVERVIVDERIETDLAGRAVFN